MKKYKEILKMFCSNDMIRYWMKDPFIMGDKVIATDGVFLVAVDKDGLDYNQLSSDYVSKVSKSYPMDYNMNFPISVEELKSLLSAVPLIEEEETKPCDECNGVGEVTWEYDTSERTYEKELDCPVCNGEGEIIIIKKGVMVRSPLDLCKIGNCSFFIDKIDQLIKVAEILEVNEIIQVNQTLNNKANMFKIGDIEIMLMPTIINKDDFYHFVL
jgi:hypothetical protein